MGGKTWPRETGPSLCTATPREGAASTDRATQPHGWESLPRKPAFSDPESDARALGTFPAPHLPVAICFPPCSGTGLQGVPVLIHKAPSSLAELRQLVRRALPLGSWLRGSPRPRKVEGRCRRAGGKGEWGKQQQGQKRVAASQTTAEEEDGDDEEAAEEDGEEGLFQNSHRRLGCRFRWR